MMGAATSLILTLALAAAPPTPRADTTITLGDQPVVIAFLGADMGEVMYSADWARLLATIKPGLDAARPELTKLPVVVREVYAPGVLLRSRGREWAMAPAPSKVLVGYYLWAPDGPAYVCAGGLPAGPLVALVERYLAERAKPAPEMPSACERAES